MGITEQAFYIPHLRTRLPDGNKVLQNDEKKDREYDNQRRMDQELILDSYDVNDSSSSETKFEKEMAETKSQADRRIIQTIFNSSPDEEDASLFDLNQQRYEDDYLFTRNQNTNENDDASSQSSTVSDLRKAEIIQSVAKPIATGDWSSLKKNKPNPSENPILRDWKRRISESPTILKNDAESSGTAKLPPFPSDEHFVGIWSLDLFPKGGNFEEEGILNENKNEDIVLRVDGTTAGGPILDVQNQHRAAGGTWKFFQAQWVGGPSDEGSEAPLKTRLRIRLLIPPLREKVILLEGEVTNGFLATAESISQENMKELRKSAFESFVGMKENNRKEEYKVLKCAGEMWCEDATGAGNREERKRIKLGRFHLIKEMYQPRNYNYSIPSPQRFQD